jgi:hypothetical protein
MARNSEEKLEEKGRPTVIIRAEDKTRVYGENNPVFTHKVIKPHGVETPHFDVLCQTEATVDSPVNDQGYDIVPTLVAYEELRKTHSERFHLKTEPGKLTITPAAVTVTAGNATRPYGADNPAFPVTVGANRDSLTATANSAADSGSSVGNYDIVPVLTGPVDKLVNYTPVPISGTLTVTPAPLTVTAQGAARCYGEPNPPFTATVSSNPDGITAIATSTADNSSAVGEHSVIPALIDPNNKLANYALTQAPGKLTVAKAKPVFKVSPVSIRAGAVTAAVKGSISTAYVSPSAGTVECMLNQTTTSVPINKDGTFSASFDTRALKPSTYPVSFSFAGDDSFDEAASQTTLQVTAPPAMSMSICSDPETALFKDCLKKVNAALQCPQQPFVSCELESMAATLQRAISMTGERRSAVQALIVTCMKLNAHQIGQTQESEQLRAISEAVGAMYLAYSQQGTGSQIFREIGGLLECASNVLGTLAVESCNAGSFITGKPSEEIRTACSNADTCITGQRKWIETAATQTCSMSSPPSVGDYQKLQRATDASVNELICKVEMWSGLGQPASVDSMRRLADEAARYLAKSALLSIDLSFEQIDTRRQIEPILVALKQPIGRLKGILKRIDANGGDPRMKHCEDRVQRIEKSVDQAMTWVQGPHLAPELHTFPLEMLKVVEELPSLETDQMADYSEAHRRMSSLLYRLNCLVGNGSSGAHKSGGGNDREEFSCSFEGITEASKATVRVLKQGVPVGTMVGDSTGTFRYPAKHGDEFDFEAVVNGFPVERVRMSY